MKIFCMTLGQMATNCYLAYTEKSKEAVIIDPADSGDYILERINELRLKPVAIIATHGHFDHILAVTELKLSLPKTNFYIHKSDLNILKRTKSTAKYFLGINVDPPILPDKYLENNMVIRFGSDKLKIMETPGHTPGSVCIYEASGYLFSGDTIFADGNYGRTDLSGGNYQQLMSSIKLLMNLPNKTKIYSGHGLVTTIEKEKKYYENTLTSV